jgi:hypothetical protein
MNNIIRLLSICFLTQIYLSKQLWFRNNFKIPCISPIFADYHLSENIVWGLSTILVLALLGLIVKPQERRSIYPILLILLLFFAFDGLFLQIWIWFYFLLFILFLPSKHLQNDEKTLQTLQFVIAGIYFWSGFFKLGPYFVEDSFSWFLEPIPILRDLGKYPILGYWAAFFEISLGIGLLIPKTRSNFKFIAVFFHVFIMLVLSPLGHNWNTLVLPWNVAMIGLIFLCFETKKNGTEPIFSFKTLKLNASSCVLKLAWIGPLLSLFSLFPRDFTWRMYSGTHSEMTFYFQEESLLEKLKIPQEKVFGKNSLKITLEDWLNDQTGVLPPDSEAYYRNLGRYLCQFVTDKSGSGILILNTDMWDKSKESIREMPCE